MVRADDVLSAVCRAIGRRGCPKAFDTDARDLGQASLRQRKVAAFGRLAIRTRIARVVHILVERALRRLVARGPPLMLALRRAPGRLLLLSRRAIAVSLVLRR